MADTIIGDAQLEKLRQKVNELASATGTLAALFENEASGLKRKDEVAQLNALRSAILKLVRSAKDSEMAARSGYSQARLIGSLVGLGIGGPIALTSQDKGLRAVARSLMAGTGEKDRPFGTVLVCIGPKGLPEGVDVVSVSRLARESKRDEFGVMEELREHGYILLGEEAFSLFIDRLADEIIKGNVDLPVSQERLSKIQVFRPLRLNPPNRDWVARRQTQ